MVANVRFKVDSRVDPDGLVGMVALEVSEPLTGSQTMTARDARALGKSLVRAADVAQRAAKRARKDAGRT